MSKPHGNSCNVVANVKRLFLIKCKWEMSGERLDAKSHSNGYRVSKWLIVRSYSGLHLSITRHRNI